MVSIRVAPGLIFSNSDLGLQIRPGPGPDMISGATLVNTKRGADCRAASEVQWQTPWLGGQGFNPRS